MDGISVGAVGAAVIAALVSFVGLILAKEQKTSEFRQQWIDSLRSEIATYLSNISAISDQLRKTYANKNEKLSELAPYYTLLNAASFLIRLRINPKEAKPLAVLAAMGKFEDLSKNDASFTSENVEKVELEMLAASQRLLKFEWERVKNGELTFRLTKYLACTVAIVLSGLLIYASVKSVSSLEDNSRKAFPSIEKVPERKALRKEIPATLNNEVSPVATPTGPR